MILKINGTDIYMVRGDTRVFTLRLYDQMQKIELSSGDTIYFTVKKSIYTPEITIEKVITTFEDNEAIIEILPEDTKELEYGDYVYDIQWTDVNESITTLVEASKFVIKGEVTYE